MTSVLQEPRVRNSSWIVEEEQLESAEDRRAGKPAARVDDKRAATQFVVCTAVTHEPDRRRARIVWVDEAATTDFHQCPVTVFFLEGRRRGLVRRVCVCLCYLFLSLSFSVCSIIHACNLTRSCVAAAGSVVRMVHDPTCLSSADVHDAVYDGGRCGRLLSNSHSPYDLSVSLFKLGIRRKRPCNICSQTGRSEIKNAGGVI